MERRKVKGGRRPFPFTNSDWGKGGRAPPLGLPLSFPLRPIRLNSFPGGSGNPSGTPVCTQYISEHFWCPNTTFQYINLYLSIISRLLVMSVILSGTPNNIRSLNHISHITLCRQQPLSVRTLRVQELCRHDQDTSPVNNQ